MDQLELCEIGENVVPIFAREIAPYWINDDGEERFFPIIALAAIGYADPAYPPMVTGNFSIPDRGAILPCVDPDGQAFTGRMRGGCIEEGHLSIEIEVLGSEIDDQEGSDDG